MKKMEEDMKKRIIDNVSIEDSDEALEYIDLYACYEPVFEPPLDFLEECRKRWAALTSPFRTTIERKIGNTRYIIETECTGRELLTDKAKRLICGEWKSSYRKGTKNLITAENQHKKELKCYGISI